jgi:hypothetical protein
MLAWICPVYPDLPASSGNVFTDSLVMEPFMLDTKLILIEGLPGSGKSTTTGYLRAALQRNGFDCRQYLEEDDPHPIPGLDFELKGLSGKVIPLWEAFVEQATQEPAITIIESRLWQNTAMFMYMGGCDTDEIFTLNQQMWNAIMPLSPALLYLDQDDTEEALRRLYTFRGNEWMQWALETTTSYAWFRSRGLNDFAGWVRFFKEWRGVVEELFRDWPGKKMKILSAHDN